MEQWWDYNGKGKLKNLEKKLSQCQFIHYKSNKDWLGIENWAFLMTGQQLPF
jgi:hypothetical protein